MKNYDEIIADQQKLSDERKARKEQLNTMISDKSWQMGLLKYLLDNIPELDVKVLNEKDLEPALKKIEEAVKGQEVVKEVTVKNLKDIVIPETKEVVKVSNLSEIKIPEVKIPSTVKVSNLNEIKFPEINIPEPKEVDLSVLVKELKDLKKGLTTKETIDTSKMENTLSDVLSLLEKVLQKPEKEIVFPETDLEPVVRAAKETTKAINSLTFPVPNFSSSWQHSLTMQSDDLAKTISYKTVSGKEVVDYFEFVGIDGNTYRKTFNYRADGKALGWTGWEKQ